MALARRHDETERGLSLIELMVTIAVIAVLIGIAIPAFQGFRNRAQDASAQSTLRIAEEDAQFVVLTRGGFPDDDELLTLLSELEPNLEWVAADQTSTGPRVVSISQIGPPVQGLRGLTSRRSILLKNKSDQPKSKKAKSTKPKSTKTGSSKDKSNKGKSNKAAAKDDNNDRVSFAVRSAAGGCFYARVSADSTVIRHLDSSAESCVAENFESGPGSGW